MRNMPPPTVRSIAIIDQEALDGPLAEMCRALSMNTNCCGFVACAVAAHLATHARPVMTERSLAALVMELRDPTVMLPPIEAIISQVRSTREAHAASEQWSSAEDRNAFVGGIAREPEVSCWLRSAGCGVMSGGNVSMMRAIQLGPSRFGLIRWGDIDSPLTELEHEDERAYTREEAPFRTHWGADFFFEVGPSQPLAAQPHGPSGVLPPPPPGSLESTDGWQASHGNGRWLDCEGGSAVIVNWWGHFGVYMPVLIAAAEADEEEEQQQQQATPRDGKHTEEMELAEGASCERKVSGEVGVLSEGKALEPRSTLNEAALNEADSARPTLLLFNSIPSAATQGDQSMQARRLTAVTPHGLARLRRSS